MNANTEKYGIEVSYDRQNTAIVKLSDYTKLLKELQEYKAIIGDISQLQVMTDDDKRFIQLNYRIDRNLLMITNDPEGVLVKINDHNFAKLKQAFYEHRT